jgi:hypothetical protein
MTDEAFPSGPWLGFYTYGAGRDRHRMDLGLTFANGRITGDGNDDIGAFVIRGRYDSTSKECHWTKTYIGAHDVFYRGFREGKGIWGKWEIGKIDHGGFHVWPLAYGEDEGETESEASEEPVEAVSELERTG